MAIDYNKMIPIVYAIANFQNVDLGVGDSMMQTNIRVGQDQYRGQETLPVEYQANWSVLHITNPDLAAVNGEFNAFIRKRQKLMPQLAEMWNAKNYKGMIRLMEASDDPGPVSVPAREEWEKEKEESKDK